MVPAEIADDTPGVKLVWILLADEEATSQSELRKRSQLDRHTVREALHRLEEVGLATELGIEPTDLRTTRWEATPPSVEVRRDVAVGTAD